MSTCMSSSGVRQVAWYGRGRKPPPSPPYGPAHAALQGPAHKLPGFIPRSMENVPINLLFVVLLVKAQQCFPFPMGSTFEIVHVSPAQSSLYWQARAAKFCLDVRGGGGEGW